MWRTRIEIKGNIATYANVSKAAQLAVDNQGNKTTDNNKKAKIYFANIELIVFDV